MISHLTGHYAHPEKENINSVQRLSAVGILQGYVRATTPPAARSM